MIELDMKMPANCRECPCSYYIRTGDLEGRMMCEAMEYIDFERGAKGCLVDDNRNDRPANCPMKEITVVYDPT